jgi:RNA polymerase sigma-70 factor, ECF subfamily
MRGDMQTQARWRVRQQNWVKLRTIRRSLDHSSCRRRRGRVERHNVRIILFVRLISGAGPAEGVVGEVFADVWRQTSKFEGRSQVPTWILSIARFEALSERGRGYDAEFDEAVALLIADESDTPEEAVLKMGTCAELRLCMKQLSTEHAKSSASFTAEKTVKDVAEISQMPT